MAWVLRSVEIGAEGEGPGTDARETSRSGDLCDIAGLGLALAEAKLLPAGVQREAAAVQARDHAVSALFGQVAPRPPRFRCAACGGTETGLRLAAPSRSTPELDRLGAHLCALTTYGTAADVLEQTFPADAGAHHGTLRRHTLRAGEALGEVAAKAVIVEEVERLHWRTWNGKARDAQISIGRIRAVVHHCRGEPDQRRPSAASRKLWTALRALDGYLTSQGAWLVNCAERHRAGLRVGTAITEGTASSLVNRRMNKPRRVRWSRRGADLLLQARCAAHNGTLGSGFGQRFQAADDPHPPAAIAA